MRLRIAILMLFNLTLYQLVGAQSLQFKGQASAWGNYNPENELNLWGGARYLPQVNARFGKQNNRLFDFEASLNLNGMLGSNPFDTLFSDGQIKPYRFWLRYSTRQMEIRAGLQKINFGSASMIRPLMWFDRLDPRDPLQLTDGVWGVLGRYYFLNNANVWLWVLYGNKKPKTWELGGTSMAQPELGGRFQVPVPGGEMGLSVHHRLVDGASLGVLWDSDRSIPENRIGIDGKWDVGVGLWFEAVWLNKTKGLGSYTNQTALSIGADYTFGWGNGLNLIVEQLFFSYDEKPFAWVNPYAFATLSLSYPLGLNDNLSTMTYYDWTHQGIYNIVTWSHQFSSFTLYGMGYCNPRDYNVPLTSTDVNLFAGTGIQMMLVWNY